VGLSAHVPDLAALEVLLAVAGTGSLNSAEQQAGVSQQAVSARIRAMEAQTGVALVHRSPRGSSLTAEGAVIAEWAARLLDVAAGLDAGIAALRQDRRGRLRVSASSTIARATAAGLAGVLPRRRPAIRPRPRDRADRRQHRGGHHPRHRGDRRCRVHRGPPAARRAAQQGHRPRPAGRGRRCRPSLARRRRGVSAAELAATPLASREGGSGTRDALTAALAAALGPGAEQAPAALSLPTTAAVRAAVLAAAAPAVISELAVTDDLASGRLVRVETPDLDLRRVLRAVWDGPRNPPAGAARDLIAHVLSGQPRNATAAGQAQPPGELAPVRGRRDDRLAQADTAVVARHPRVHEHAEPARLQPGGRPVQQQQVLEHPAGQRDGAQPRPLAQQQAAAGDEPDDAAVEAGSDDLAPGPLPQVRHDRADQVRPAHPERLGRLDPRPVRPAPASSPGSASWSSSIAACPS
jgi:DNA-binding transcriptional LysR family regulator